MKFGSSIKSIALFCLLNNQNPFVKADQPVHCLADDIFGEWEFSVDAKPETINVFAVKDVCTHTFPNKV